MKLTKLFSGVAILAFLFTSCSSDDNNEPIRPDNKDQIALGSILPIEGTYVFPHTPTMPLPFKFESNKITIIFEDKSNQTTAEDVYDVLSVYKNTSKDEIIKAVTKSKSTQEYKTFFFKDQKEESVLIHMDYSFPTQDEAIKSAYPTETKTTTKTITADNPHGNMKFGWLKLEKEEDKVQNMDKLKGVYGSEIIMKEGNPTAQYVFKINSDEDAFLFRANMGKGFGDSASFILKKVATDEAKGQLIYEVTGSTGYYEGRTGQYLTIYVKDISADGAKATFAIATKDGSNSVAGSKGDVVGKTIEEAKAIKAPEASQVWENDMMNYAHKWMPTTRE
ncbi:hypothetical protein [Myroides sp. LoEW2-1]|uniref:hypothetical protein n=1 Tax=Myroides sp. LoEW2-1 TaxID=2683192 RepID=UPI001325FD14|nr:hypothetical protein [Myroides sp. LoEW2-1]MVX35576.1 hypothetical protein [Myroides sp. LoEW2-1]